MANTLVVGLISNNDETPYLEEVAHLTLQCRDNSLLMNVTKAKELIVDYYWGDCQPLLVPGSLHLRGSVMFSPHWQW